MALLDDWPISKNRIGSTSITLMRLCSNWILPSCCIGLWILFRTALQSLIASQISASERILTELIFYRLFVLEILR